MATEAEVRALALARRGGEFHLVPPRSSMLTEPELPTAEDAISVVSQAFAEVEHGGSTERWISYEHHGFAVSGQRDATLELLRLVDETTGDLVDLLADMRIAGLGVSRWELMSAPRRVELAPSLGERLTPLRRG